jgi:predicted dehydrogenase
MDYLFDSTPSSIHAYGVLDRSLGQEVAAYVHAHYPHKLTFHAQVSWMSPIKTRRLTIIGTKKIAVVDDIESENKFKLYSKTGKVKTFKLDTTEALFYVVADFIRAIKTHSAPIADGTQGMRVVKCIETTNKSIRTNKTST